MWLTGQYSMSVTETGPVADAQTEGELNLSDDCHTSIS